MKIHEYFASKEVKAKEIQDNFKQVATIHKDMIHHKEGCLTCGDTINHYGIKSEPWTGCMYCAACRSIELILFSDRMGGTHTDVVYIYKEK